MYVACLRMLNEQIIMIAHFIVYILIFFHLLADCMMIIIVVFSNWPFLSLILNVLDIGRKVRSKNRTEKGFISKKGNCCLEQRRISLCLRSCHARLTICCQKHQERFLSFLHVNENHLH